MMLGIYATLCRMINPAAKCWTISTSH